MFQIKATSEEIRLADEFMQNIFITFTYGAPLFPEGFQGKDGIYTGPDNAMWCEFPFVTSVDLSFARTEAEPEPLELSSPAGPV